MSRHAIRTAACLGTLFLITSSTAAIAQDPIQMVVKTYLVYDMVAAVPNHRFNSVRLPTTERVTNFNSPFVGGSAGGLLGVMGGMGGYGGGGMGGGFYNVQSGMQGGVGPGVEGGGGMGGMGGMGGGYGMAMSNHGEVSTSNLLAISSDELIGLITSIVAPDSWDEVGGPGSIEMVGGMLVVRNEDSVHKQIGDLLDSLRQVEERGKVVTLKAKLLRLTVKQLEELTDPASPYDVKPEVLSKLSDTPSLAYCAQYSCLNGQTCFVVLGERNTVATGGIPVVGGQSMGYSMQTAIPNSGAMIETTTLVLPGGELAIVDVHGVVSAMLDCQPLQIGEGQIDRVQMGAAQLATTVRVDLGKPFLVGGLTDTQAMADDGKLADQQQFYLVARSTVTEWQGEEVTR